MKKSILAIFVCILSIFLCGCANAPTYSLSQNTDGTVTVKDLTFGNFKCNQTNEQNLVCDNK